MKTCEGCLPLLGPTAALVVVLASPPTYAQAQDQAAARALFEDGRRLLKEGKYEEACQTLEAASKLYSSAGILLNLGDCYEKIGRTASAWTEFGEAVTVATRAHRNDQVSEAKRRQAAVEPKLTKLTIHVTGQITGLTISRDDSEIASAAWGEAIPVDPGSHQIKAEATGHQPWSTSVDVSAEGQTVTVEVPTLATAPAPPPVPIAHEAEPASTEPAPSADATPVPQESRAVSWILVGGGSAVAIAGGVLWGLGSSKSHTASDASTATHAEYQSAANDYKSAKTLYFVGVAGVGVGVATATIGVLLMKVGHKGERHAPSGALRAMPWVAPEGGGMRVAGGW